MAKYIIFVHGLGGEREKTWGRFPEFLINDNEIKHEIIQYSYTSPNPIKQLYKPAPSILSIANGLLTYLTAHCNLDNDDIILVGHSLGGLVIRRMLLRLNAKGVNHNIQKVCFFDVPHEGSGFANVGRYVAFLNRHLKSLVSNSTELDDLNEQWVDKKIDERLNILSVIDANETIVSAMSSKSIFRFHKIETINGVDHSTIVKPKTVNDTAVLVLKSFIKSKPSIGKFNNNNVSKSIADWLKYDERRHELEYLEDKAREIAYKSLKGALESSTPIIRLTGLSGLGKSRLLIEYKNRNHIKDEDLIIINGAGNSEDVIHCLKLAVENKAEGLAVIDNCSTELHNKLVKIVSANNSLLKMVSTFFYHDSDGSLDSSIQIKLEKLEENLITQIIHLRLPNLDELSEKRLNKFIEGFPLLADMATKELQKEGVIRTSFSEKNLVEKLINGDNNLTDKQRELLKVFSLFDYFRFQKNKDEKANKHAIFLNEIAGTNQIEFEGTVKHFEDKGLINCTGRLARIIPKPLALNLAMEWWDGSLFDRQNNLIINLPESMLESFCRQLTYLDSSLNIQDFVKNFCEDDSPFGQAELLLSNQGSRLFRALVEVNPNVTNELLYRTFKSISDKQIKEIGGNARRSLIWALEMLVFHDVLFEKSSWCLFKLAQFENESYGNNATGQFSQLFRLQLSGTQANFKQRLTILNKVARLNKESADSVLIEAIKVAIDSHGGNRIVGAEFQGTKAELKEWRPKKWQEIFDYWEALLDIYLNLVKKEHLVDAVKDAFGHEIRSLIKYIPLGTIDGFIKSVVASSGKYWPAAAQSISHALYYDINNLKDGQLTAIKEWERLLLPAADNLEEQLKLVVLNPSREYKKGEDDHYIDIAAEGAIALARELKDRLLELVPYFELLMTFPEQKQTWVFAKEIALCCTNYDEFLSSLLSYLRLNSKSNTRFISGFSCGLSLKNPEKWEYIIKLFGSDNLLHTFYPYAMTSGNFNKAHLNILIRLIKEDLIINDVSSLLIYNNVTKHLSESEIAAFCAELSKLDTYSAWIALDILSMYIHGRSDYDYDTLKPVFIELVLTVSFKKGDKLGGIDVYQWQKAAEDLLQIENEEFSIKLCKHLIQQVTNNDVDYSDLWDYLNLVFYKAFELHGKYIWPVIQNEFIKNEGIKKYRLAELFYDGKERHQQENSIFTLLDEYLVIEWCEDKEALLFVAHTLSLFETKGEKKTVNSLLLKLIENYGDNDLFLNEISANYHSRSWSGSLVPYLEKDKEYIEPFKVHKCDLVQQWATDFCNMIDRDIDKENKRDAENDMLRNFHN